MFALGVILARAGSKGLPGKCVRPLHGRPLVSYALEHARSATRLNDVILSTDCPQAKSIARDAGIAVVDRPAPLATDTARVDDAARHAVEAWEQQHARRVDAVVILYANIPLRRDGLIDQVIEHLESSGADSVRTVAPVSKQHPDWLHRLAGDRMQQYRENGAFRRQDLEPLYYHDGAVLGVTRSALFTSAGNANGQAFLGNDRRAIVQSPKDTVDVDTAFDLRIAEALLSDRENERMDSRSAPVTRDASLKIGSRQVGSGEPVYIIAEAGVNHDGDVQLATELVNAAADAGADAVKFQYFRTSELAVVAAPGAAYQHQACGATDQHEMLSRLEFDRDKLMHISEHCRARDITLILTPFSHDLVPDLVELGSAAVKIASTDLTHHVLLTAAAATRLPIILSTGASTAAEIGRSVEYIHSLSAASRTALLHCVSCYPVPRASAQLGSIGALQSAFGLPVGFSDHTLDEDTGALAVAAGACILEKHFTLDRSRVGPDHAMSLNPQQLARYIARARDAWRCVGSPTFGQGVSALEQDVRTSARRSIVARHRIPCGSRITADSLAFKRPGTGISPERQPELMNRIARRDIEADCLISWDMVQ